MSPQAGTQLKTKNPSALKRTGFWPIALAAFVERPQADESNRRYLQASFYAWRLGLAIPGKDAQDDHTETRRSHGAHGKVKG